MKLRNKKWNGLGRKAQVPTTIMTYVLTVILFGMIMVFGYNVIVSMRESGESVSLVQFKTQIETDVKSMAQETGRTVRTYEYVSPGSFTKICFADSDYIAGGTRITKGNCPEVIKKSVIAKIKSNVFLFPGAYNYEVGDVLVQDGCRCFDIKAGRITLMMKGEGDRTNITEPKSP